MPLGSKRELLRVAVQLGAIVLFADTIVTVAILLAPGKLTAWHYVLLHALGLAAMAVPLILWFGARQYARLRKASQTGPQDQLEELRNAMELAADAQLELSQVKQALDDHCIVEVFDALGTIISTNQKFCEISGYSRDEIVGKDVHVVSSGYHTQSFYDEIYRTIIQGKTWSGEIKNRAKDGSYFWANTTLTPIKNAAGEILKCIAVRTDTTEHHKTQEQLLNLSEELHQAAFFDALTGLPNRAHCQKDMVEMISWDNREETFTMIQIDLDNFKRVNDSLGHAAGDFLLRQLAQRMKFMGSHFENAKFYRWGGDEFIAIIRQSKAMDAKAFCEELTDVISVPLHYQTAKLWPTVSLGVANYPEDAQDLESLMVFADLALYKTKQLGRDGFQFFSSEMKEKVDAETATENDLRHALERQELELYFQPQLNTRDERITGIEALVRWNHPKRGLLSPGQFLPIAESSGLAPAIGCKAMELAMTAVSNWAAEGLEFGRLAINLSPNHIKRGEILTDFFSCMRRYNVDPRHLSVEFLESFMFDGSEEDVVNVLQEFRSNDIQVMLDDFGTGYASLSHLVDLPINGLKIDKSFVHNVDIDHRRHGMLTSLVSMSDLMGLRIVCEGIENWQQFEVISDIANCSIQGYLVAKPMSFDDMTRWIREGANRGVLEASSAPAAIRA